MRRGTPYVSLANLNMLRKPRESKFALRFRHWLRAQKLDFSATFELKDCSDKKSFAFSELKEEQENWALAISEGKGVLMRQMGGNGEPDYTYHYKDPAFVVINFKEGFTIITIQNLLQEKVTSTRKSLTYARAKLISSFSG